MRRQVFSHVLCSSSKCSAVALRSCASAPSTSFAAGLFRVKIVGKEVFPYPIRKFTEDEGENLESLVRHVQGAKEKTQFKDLIEWGSPGAAIPTEYGGLQLSETAHSVSLEETARNSPAAAYLPLLRHVGNCTYLIKNFGSKEVKAKYLSGMSDASIRMAWAVAEEHAGTDVSMNTASAIANGDGSFSISGSKVVVEGGDATHFLVLVKAPTQATSVDGSAVMAHKGTFFVVDRSAKGVRVELPATGSPSRSAAVVHLDNVIAENIVGVVGEGHVQYLVTLHSCHHLVSATFIGIAKKALTIAMRYVNAQTQAKNGSQLLQAIVSSATAELYGLEASLYALTANLDVPAADSLIEATTSAALTARSVETLVRRLYAAVQYSTVGGGDAEMATVLQEMDHVMRLTETESFLYACGAACGVEDFGLYFQKASTLETLQNRALRSMGFRDKLPVATAWPEAQKIEEAVLTFGAAVEHVFVRSNVRLRHQSLVLNRLGEAAALILASACSVARVLMADNKGVESAKIEKKLASVFIARALARVDSLCFECRNSGKTADEAFKRIAAEACEEAFATALASLPAHLRVLSPPQQEQQQEEKPQPIAASKAPSSETIHISQQPSDSSAADAPKKE